MGEHGEQCDTGCDVQYPNRRYRKLSRECERELERKSHRAIPEAHQTPIFRYRTYRRFVQPERKPYQRGTAGDAGAQYDPQHDTECQPAFWLPAPMGGFDLTGDWRFRHSTNLCAKPAITPATTAWGERLRRPARRHSVAERCRLFFPQRDEHHPGEDDQVVWNASLSWRFLKQKKAELSFYWADILSQKRTLPAASLPPDCRRDTRSR